jgi:hypothetical protein
MLANSIIRSLFSAVRISLALLLSALIASPDLVLAQEPITCGGTGWTNSTVTLDPPSAPSGYGVETFGAALNGSTLYILGGEQWINQVPTFQTKVLHKSAVSITNGNTTGWFTDNFWKDPNTSPQEVVGYARDLCGAVYTSPSNVSYLYTVGGVYYDSQTALTTGSYGSSTNWVWYTKINANGSLVQPWTRAADLPTGAAGLQLHGTAVVAVGGNTYMYVIGGSTDPAGDTNVGQYVSAKTYYGLISPTTGGIASWTAGPKIKAGLKGLGVYKTCPVVDPVNGTIYVAGGESANGSGNEPAVADVWYTTPTAANPFPAWTLAGQINPNNVVTPDAAQAVAFTNGSIYLMGGDSTGQGGDWCTVMQGQVGSTPGQITWNNNTAMLPGPVSRNAGIAYNGYLYSMGGVLNATSSPDGDEIDWLHVGP